MTESGMTKAPKVEYSEEEAAKMLGIAIEELRSLVCEHIVKGDEAAATRFPCYRASDLVMLRIFAGMSRQL